MWGSAVTDCVVWDGTEYGSLCVRAGWCGVVQAEDADGGLGRVSACCAPVRIHVILSFPHPKVSPPYWDLQVSTPCLLIPSLFTPLSSLCGCDLLTRWTCPVDVCM